MTQTIFERIIDGEIPSAPVYQDDAVYAFMDAGQVNPGHVVLALRRPAETIMDLTDDEASAVFVAAAKISRAVQEAFAPAGITVLQANKPAG